VLLCEHASLKARGWDHVNYITIATVVGGAALVGVTREQTEQALGIAVVPHVAMRKGRAGELTMWKAATAANAARNAVFALELAACGMRGPDAPFEGTKGFDEQLDGEEFV
jgi:2-methylcitrate dehydratase